jgi:hypothetical protein
VVADTDGVAIDGSAGQAVNLAGVHPGVTGHQATFATGFEDDG